MPGNKRFDAVCAISNRRLEEISVDSQDMTSHYGEDVFSQAEMKRRLKPAIYRKLASALCGMAPLERKVADEVAEAMRCWAMERGATHFTHWFQPLNGGTAEKHDAFLDFKAEDPIARFSGKNLTVGEPDASSFPSGGLRSTFEARGYTAWDPTSPAFIKRHTNGATLCIPTIFCSFTGQVLDRKTPLLRATQALKKAVTRLMNCFQLPPQPVSVTLGAEQEYFLIDKKFYLQRPDLVQAGCTLFGAPPAKHQQLEDHYFGSIPPRVLAFMTEVEKELWRLGIPAKTRHNEAAPAQFELAPIFEELNLAVDHNMLVMEILRTVADRNGLVCLLHEKPFAGVNGSGKHNNWSIRYGDRNLLDPGSNPNENAVFLTVLVSVLRAIDLHADLMRSSTACIGNDCRLGGNEAPPPVLSIFLGDQLTEVLDGLVTGNGRGRCRVRTMRVGVDSLPAFQMDTTDRNRTSPFAFTGNKFEFRTPGSSQSCAGVNTILNTLIADSMDYLAERLEALPRRQFTQGLQVLLKEEILAHRRVIFNGDGYTAQWQKEAEKRGLVCLKNTLEAISPLKEPKNQALFAKYGVLTEAETASRYEIALEDYKRRLAIEASISYEIARSMVRPVCLKEYAKLASVKWGVAGLAVKEYEGLLSDLQQAIDLLGRERKAGKEEKILDAMQQLRLAVDQLEKVTDDSVWPLPKYREMLFIY